MLKYFGMLILGMFLLSGCTVWTGPNQEGKFEIYSVQGPSKHYHANKITIDENNRLSFVPTNRDGNLAPGTIIVLENYYEIRYTGEK
jgi:hypothetical protein